MPAVPDVATPEEETPAVQPPAPGGAEGGYDEEPDNHVPGSFLEALPQFFVFPLILVATLTLIYLGLRMLAGGEPASARETMNEIRYTAGRHTRWQLLHNLADDLNKGRVTLEEVPAEEIAGFYRDLVAMPTVDAGAPGGDDGAMLRHYGLQIIKFKRDPALTALAVEALDDPEREVRLSALSALLELSDPASTTAALAAFERSSDEERLFAMGVLAKLGTAACLDAIATELDGDDVVSTRNAVLSLAQHGDPRAGPYLVGMLARERYDADAAIRSRLAAEYDAASADAAYANLVESFLVETCRVASNYPGLVAVRGALENLRERDPSLKVRSAAINALYDLENPSSGKEND